jgi:hypothetical protein
MVYLGSKLDADALLYFWFIMTVFNVGYAKRFDGLPDVHG